MIVDEWSPANLYAAMAVLNNIDTWLVEREEGIMLACPPTLQEVMCEERPPLTLLEAEAMGALNVCRNISQLISDYRALLHTRQEQWEATHIGL